MVKTLFRTCTPPLPRAPCSFACPFLAYVRRSPLLLCPLPAWSDAAVSCGLWVAAVLSKRDPQYVTLSAKKAFPHDCLFMSGELVMHCDDVLSILKPQDLSVEVRL